MLCGHGYDSFFDFVPAIGLRFGVCVCGSVDIVNDFSCEFFFWKVRSLNLG